MITAKIHAWTYTATILLWGVIFISFIFPITSNTTLVIQSITAMLALPFTFVSALLLARSKMKAPSTKRKYATDSPTARMLARLVPTGIVLSTFCTIQSLWTPVSTAPHDKFLLENIGVISLVVSAVLGLYLSTLQKDVFWPSKRQPKSLDERELFERNQVFEQSYRIMILISVFFFLLFGRFIDNMPALVENSTFHAVPGHVLILAWDYIAFAITTPLVVASLRKTTPKH